MIRCENLSAGYGEETVIHDISWEAAGGRLTAIVGPNGSGKSTLLKSVIGQTSVERGGVYLEGKPLKQWKHKEMAKQIAYLPQSRNDANLSVFRMVLHGRFPYLAFPRRYTQKDEEAVVRELKRMGISELREKPVPELSGGEKQRAYLAMALVQGAPILLLDEPTTYLDLSAQMELMEILRQLVAEGKTVIAVLHDLNHALQYADEMVLLENGGLKQCGTSKEILQSGVLEDVFRVRIHILQDQYGKEYYGFSSEKRMRNETEPAASGHPKRLQIRS